MLTHAAGRREHAPDPQGLDLGVGGPSGGPYLWFHSITRALSSRSARLIVDYNAHAIPLGEMDRSIEDRRRHEAWLRREARNGDEGIRACECRGKSRAVDDSVHRAALPTPPRHVTTKWARFGSQVLARLRRIEGQVGMDRLWTSPLHELPLNPGSSTFVFSTRTGSRAARWSPARLVGLGFGRVGWLMCARCAIGTIRPRTHFAMEAGAADFHVASRKIDRMRARELRRSRASGDPRSRVLRTGSAGLQGRSGGASRSRRSGWTRLPRCESRHARSSVCAQGPRSLVPPSGARRRAARSTVSGARSRVEEDLESMRALAFILVADDEIRSRLLAVPGPRGGHLRRARFEFPGAGGRRFDFECASSDGGVVVEARNA